MQTLSTKEITAAEIIEKIRSKRSKSEDNEKLVRSILEDIKKGGDKEVMRYTKKFDSPHLESLLVTEDEIEDAYSKTSKNLISALKQAKENIQSFHETHIQKKEQVVETKKGVKIWREFRPIEKVGLYIPGGKAAYPSTVLMLAVPAKIAECQEIIMCTPADRDGKCNPAVLAAARICGVNKIYKVGGAQAIAAMAYGTESIPKVYKIFGPGNQFVTTAKILLYGEVDIDMPAGPSEIGIIADETANSTFIAADFLSQLEHGEDSQSVLFTSSASLANAVEKEIQDSLKKLPRKEIINSSLKKSFAVICKNKEEICFLANEYAAEHLEIIAKEEDYFLKKINNAGSIFLGEYTSEALGDYATGANHTLPTSGFAKMFPPLSTESFGKMIQIQKVSREGFQSLCPIVETISDSEGLDAHKNSALIRKKLST